GAGAEEGAAGRAAILTCRAGAALVASGGPMTGCRHGEDLALGDGGAPRGRRAGPLAVAGEDLRRRSLPHLRPARGGHRRRLRTLGPRAPVHVHRGRRPGRHRPRTRRRARGLARGTVRRAVGHRHGEGGAHGGIGRDVPVHLRLRGRLDPLLRGRRRVDRPARGARCATPASRTVLGRDARGDLELAEDLLALLRDEPPPGRAVPVDLDAVVALLDTDPVMSTGGYLDLATGDTIPGELTDPAEVGDEYAVDVDADPDRWLRIEPAGSRDGWQDMADFADQQETGLREKLLRAIDGRGAFRRFRDTVADEGLLPRWRTFSTDRG